jgi:hypothetical protein
MTTQLPRRARRLKNLKISEVSSVDRGAGENCTIVLSKRDDTNPDVARVFKALHASCQSIIDDPTLNLGEQQDALAETMGQAHDYFSENFNFCKADADDIVEIEKGHTPMSAYDELMAKAVEICKANPKLSRHQAFAKAYSDPANRDLANADRIQRRSNNSVQKDAGDRLAMAAVRVRQSRDVTPQEAIDRARAANPDLVKAFRHETRKSRNAVDPVGRELPSPDGTRADLTNWTPEGADGINPASARVFDGSSDEQSPRSYGTSRVTISPEGGDPTGDELLDLWRQWSQVIPGLTPEDVAAMQAWKTPDQIVGKRTRNNTSVVDRVSAKAAAMCTSHKELSYDEAVQRILARDPTLAAAYQRQVAQGS